MKQSTSSHHNSPFTFFGDEEMEVSEIILQLPHLIFESDSSHRLSFTWGAKRRRSVIDLSPSPPRHRSPSLPGTCQDEAQRPITKVEASSPATPLSFSPSESDGKSKRKASKKRKKEDWLEIIDGLTQRRELLKGEIETVKRYHDKLRAFNLELKARKHELSLYLNKEKPHLEINKGLNLGMGLSQGQPTLENQEHQQIPILLHQPPFIMDQTAYGSQIFEKFQYPYGQLSPLLSSGTRLGMVNHMGPLGIPDLNVSAEEAAGLDSIQSFDLNRALTNNKNLNRAIAAQARKKRLQIKRMKNSIAAIKPYYCR